MEKSTSSLLITLTGEDSKTAFIDQYRLLLESINKLSDVRESANSFWITVNGTLIGMIAYIMDSENMRSAQKPFLLYTVLVFGFILTFSWLSSLFLIKKTLKYGMI
ncbi:MAG: hypothetical protein Q8K37_02750 [Alphaproteobacteria bacterium]|nr:hypothetical protein [Alphaproteobacteria bacterium]